MLLSNQIMRDYSQISFQTRLSRINKIPLLAVDKIPVEVGSYLTGYTDGEGSFSISIMNNRRRTKTLGIEIRPSFGVSQHISRREVLDLFKETLGCGKIKSCAGKGKYLLFSVEKQGEIINRVIPFFDRFRLISSKHHDYLRFKFICEMLVRGEDFELAGVNKAINIRNSMNLGGKIRRIGNGVVLSN